MVKPCHNGKKKKCNIKYVFCFFSTNKKFNIYCIRLSAFDYYFFIILNYFIEYKYFNIPHLRDIKSLSNVFNAHLLDLWCHILFLPITLSAPPIFTINITNYLFVALNVKQKISFPLFSLWKFVMRVLF